MAVFDMMDLRHVDRTTAAPTSSDASKRMDQSNQSEQTEFWSRSALDGVRDPWCWSWSLDAEATSALNLPVLDLLPEFNDPEITFPCFGWDQDFNSRFDHTNLNRHQVVRRACFGQGGCPREVHHELLRFFFVESRKLIDHQW